MSQKVEQVLHDDPAEACYVLTAIFNTRDHYRHVIEKEWQQKM